MADGSLEVSEELQFHCGDTPRGSWYYDFKALMHDQQEQLNVLQLKMMREDEIYLGAHPEIRAIIVLILRQILKYQPRKDIDFFVGSFFLRDKAAIEKEIEAYLTGRKTHISRGDSAVIPERESRSESLLDSALKVELEKQKRREEAETITAEVLSEILESIMEKIEAQRLEDISYIRQLVTESLVDKTGDRFQSDFKNFLIDEMVKRISSERFNYYYDEDISLEENISDELFDDFDAAASHDDQGSSVDAKNSTGQEQQNID